MKSLMIKDLALDKQLDGKAMSAVRGGGIFGANVNAFNSNTATSGFGIGNAAVVAAPVSQNLSQTELPINIAGFQLVS